MHLVQSFSQILINLCIIILNMLFGCSVYLFLTFLLPLKFTYKTFKQHKNIEALSLWSNYWAIFSIIKLFQCQISLLSSSTVRIVLLIFHLWLYCEVFRGALLLSALAHKKMSQIGFLYYIDILAQNMKIQNFFGVEGNKIKQQDVTHQNKKQK